MASWPKQKVVAKGCSKPSESSNRQTACQSSPRFGLKEKPRKGKNMEATEEAPPVQQSVFICQPEGGWLKTG